MKHTFSTHQIMNITTGRLYTSMDDIYDFANKVVSEGIMTHHLPNMVKSIRPILKLKLRDPKFWEEDFKPQTPNVKETFEFTEEDKKQFWNNFSNLPSPFEKLSK